MEMSVGQVHLLFVDYVFQNESINDRCAQLVTYTSTRRIIFSFSHRLLEETIEPIECHDHHRGSHLDDMVTWRSIFIHSFTSSYSSLISE